MKELINDCKTAELHLIQTIQPYGVLIAINRKTGVIIAYSENINEVLDLGSEQLIGKSWLALFEGSTFSFDTLSADAEDGIVMFSECWLNGRKFNLSSYNNMDTLFVEIELLTDEKQYPHHEELVFLKNLSAIYSPETAAGLLMQQIAAISDFDRVMLYKFSPDRHGKVIAEKNKPGVEGFFDLHFPAGDIPANARKLYAINLQRIIVDKASSDIKIVSSEDAPPLDLSHAQFRSVHPVHIQYLKNIGARSSFSISIAVDGELWGMVACHQLSQPKYLSVVNRIVCEKLSRITALHISGLLSLDNERRRSSYADVRAAIETRLKTEPLEKVIGIYAEQLCSAFSADGLWLNSGAKALLHGDISKAEERQALSNWLASLDQNAVYHSDTIAPQLESVTSLVQHASGLLYLPLPNNGFLVFSRNEQRENVKWAGKPVSEDKDNAENNLTPRKSFRSWSEAVRGQSRHWQSVEIEMANLLQTSLSTHFEISDLEGKASRDHLTGLGNRAYFNQMLGEIINNGNIKRSSISLFMLDLDKFKPVNDTYGHTAGDEILIAASKRLKNLIRPGDFIARFGGDEFAIILPSFNSVGELEIIAKRIIEEIQQPFKLGESSVSIAISIGIALSPEHASTTKELIEAADSALYEAKNSGRNRFKVFEMASPGRLSP